MFQINGNPRYKSIQLARTVARLIGKNDIQKAKIYYCIVNILSLRKFSLKNPKKINDVIFSLNINEYSKKEIYTKLVDKIDVKKWVQDRIGSNYLIETLYVAENVEELNYKLSSEYIEKFDFIIKPSHGAGAVFFKDDLKKRKDYVFSKLESSLKSSYFDNSFEFQYKKVIPRIIVEKLITNSNGSIPFDYKLHCFNGHCEFIQVATDKHDGNNFYDRDWNIKEMSWIKPRQKNLNSKPVSLDKMIELAEKLAIDFRYVRVDLYQLDTGEIYFGEMTFTPGGCLGEIEPKKLNYTYGNLI